MWKSSLPPFWKINLLLHDGCNFDDLATVLSFDPRDNSIVMSCGGARTICNKNNIRIMIAIVFVHAFQVWEVYICDYVRNIEFCYSTFLHLFVRYMCAILVMLSKTLLLQHRAFFVNFCNIINTNFGKLLSSWGANIFYTI